MGSHQLPPIVITFYVRLTNKIASLKAQICHLQRVCSSTHSFTSHYPICQLKMHNGINACIMASNASSRRTWNYSMSESLRSPSDLIVRFNVGGRPYAAVKTVFSSDSVFYKYFVSRTKDIPFIMDRDGAYFVDRDPESFGVILNYFRLRKSQQLWEACLPKDPDRLALLTQEAEYFACFPLRDQAIALLQACSEKSDATYVNEVLAKSASCPQGFDTILNNA